MRGLTILAGMSAGFFLLTSLATAAGFFAEDYCACALGVRDAGGGSIQVECIGVCPEKQECHQELWDLDWYVCSCDDPQDCDCTGYESTETPGTYTCDNGNTCTGQRICDEREIETYWQDACECKSV